MYEQNFNPFAANVAVVKGYFKSGKVLALGILHLVSLCLTVFSYLANPLTSSLNSTLAQLEQLGMDTSDLYSYYPDSSFMESTFSASAISAILVSSVITILTAVAFIVIFSKSRSENPESSPIAGVGILHVLAVIAFVCSIVLTGILAFAYVIIFIAAFAAAGFSDSDTAPMVVVFLLIGLLLAAVMFLVIFTAASQKNYYGSVKRSLTTVQLQNKGAKAYGVINIIFAVFMGISMIGTVISTLTGPISLNVFLPLSSSVVSFVILIFDASLALGYARYINQYKFGYSSGAPADAYVPASPDAQNPYAQQPYSDGYNSYTAPPQQNPYSDGYTGAPAQPAPYCPHCGAPVDTSAPFCSNCGNKL